MNCYWNPNRRNSLIQIVEAARNVERDKRQKFGWSESSSSSLLHHPGFPSGNISVYGGDLDALVEKGLLRSTSRSPSSAMLDVTPEGFQYYVHLKEVAGESLEQVAVAIAKYLETASFLERHPRAHEKWREADRLLWSTDSELQLTTVGHLCREAVQLYVTELVERVSPPDVEPDVTNTVSRVRQALKHLGLESKQVSAFLEALVAYWGTLNDLIQRQEHGAQKEGEELVWEDARRVVFQTAVVMYELDVTVARLH